MSSYNSHLAIQRLEIFLFHFATYLLLYKKKYPVDFDDELKIRDVRYDNMTKITIKVQLF